MEDINSQVKISSLDFPDNVRENPRIYLSSINHCLNEIIDNSVDEYKAGICKHIAVTLSKDGTICVLDDGRGIPVAQSTDKKHKGFTQAEIALSTLSAGGKFAGAENSYKEETSGQNGRLTMPL